MDFEKQVQKALRTLRNAFEHHQNQSAGYGRSIARLQDIQKSVPAEAKVAFCLGRGLTFYSCL